LAKASVFRIPIIGRIIAACGQIPVERGSAQSKDALVAAAQALQQGRALVIYPEGTITYDPDLWPMKGKTGSARLALTTGCPVVPIGQWGAQELMPGRKPRFPKPLPRKTLRVAAGEEVLLDDLRSRPVTAATLDEATRRIMDAITVLVAELRDVVPPSYRYDPRSDQTSGDPT
jgi:1-acyl-sn-glycerol-3-phosphate acyltransferase